MSAFSKYGITRITGNINEELMIVLSLKLVLLVERERESTYRNPPTDRLRQLEEIGHKPECAREANQDIHHTDVDIPLTGQIILP